MNDTTTDTSVLALTASDRSAASALDIRTITTPDAPARVSAKRGRKPETPAQRLERLARQLAEAKVAAKEAERRTHCVVGEALLAEAEEDASLRSRIIETLRKRVTTASAKADIASLLVG